MDKEVIQPQDTAAQSLDNSVVQNPITYEAPKEAPPAEAYAIKDEPKKDLSIKEKLYQIKEVADKRDEAALDKEVDEILKDTEDAPVVQNQALPQPGQPQAQQQVVYNPNYKFKANNKEYEFDEEFRGIITNEDREKKIRELHEKAFGLDSVKAASQRTQEEYSKLKDQYNKIDQGIGVLNSMLQRGDIDGFAKSMGIPQEKFVNWVLDKVKYNQATPEQRQQIDSQRTAQQQAWESQQRLTQLEQQNEATKTSFLQREMDLVLSQPDVKAFAEAWDKQAGRPNAFFEYVRERGLYNYALRGVDSSAKQAVDEALSLLKPHLKTDAMNAPAPQGIPTPSVQQQFKPRVIPNVQGTSASPVSGKQVKSVKDLKDIYKERFGDAG